MQRIQDVRHQARPRLEVSHEREAGIEPRNPFDSPNLSTCSLNDTDGGSTSEQDEFHLQRYSSNAKYKHFRQLSQPTDGEERDRKPDLNIITNFGAPNMPMKAQAVVVNKVPAKQVRADRKNKAISVMSHKAVPSMASPPDDGQKDSAALRKRRQSREPRKVKPTHRLQSATTQAQLSPPTQRIPIGITIPKEDAARVDQTMIDSALSTVTPMTPAIVVTPAGNQKPWVLHQRGVEDLRRPASSIYSAMPGNKIMNISFVPQTAEVEHDEKVEYRGPRTSQESSEMILADSADTARPKSQGWWNLMLSPLLRAGSLASRKGRQQANTPPIPPLPFASEKDNSPALSARSDPSFLVSSTKTSPDTPRRQGLAGVRASTWSQWTEWEQEREANGEKGVDGEGSQVNKRNLETEVGEQLVPVPNPTTTGLAAEYFHACAIEQLTGRPYFECINHSCAEKLPKLRSVHDKVQTSGIVLASPFESPMHSRGVGLEDAVDVKSPSILDKDENLSPNELSPNVRQANIVPVVKAKALDSLSDKESETKFNSPKPETTSDKAVDSQPAETMAPAAATYSAPRNDDDLPNIAAIAPPPQVVEVRVVHEKFPQPTAFEPLPEKAPVFSSVAVASPGSISPEGQKSIAPMGAVPLSELEHKQAPYAAPVVFNNYANHDSLPHRPAFITAETEYPPLPDRAPTAPVTAADLNTSRRLSIEERRQRYEKEDATAKKVGGLWRGRGCFPKSGCMSRGGPEKRAKRRWIIGLSLAMMAVIITCIVLAVTLTRRGDGTPVDSQWLNLTGYPPMPTGILTIAAPNLASQQKQCVGTTTIWSCSVPKEDIDEIGSNESDQPNFRFEIKFRNGTVPTNMTIPLNGTNNIAKTSTDPFTNDLFVPNPTPPNQADQLFIGRTTDNITTPFDGEQTPFYMTFIPSFPIDPSSLNQSSNTNNKRLLARQSNSSIVDSLPGPSLAADGSAAPANLLPTNPYPISQPVRLYNRGEVDEHYGFYAYYDKSIYLSGVRINSTSVSPGSKDPADLDQNGGCTKSQANSMCTFSQTRFLVKIFTNAAFGGKLLQSNLNANLTTPEDAAKAEKNKTSSATDFDRPGSFPYPTTIIIDRHGGDIDSKAAYCYGMSNGQINKDEKIIVAEVRSFGGTLVNASPDLLAAGDGFNSTAGGIDGGTGGCGCNWQNWQ